MDTQWRTFTFRRIKVSKFVKIQTKKLKYIIKMGILLKKTFPLYAVQVGDQVHVTRQVEQGREWQRKATKEHKPTAYKICRSWEGVKKFRQAVLTPLLVEKVRSKMRERLVEALSLIHI